jgi:hypothetical protein
MWYQHNKGKKHLKNVQNAEQNNNHKGQKMVTVQKKKGHDTKKGQEKVNDTEKGQNKVICNYCQKSLSNKSHLTRHYTTCKKKLQIVKSGLYCMWNPKMVDNDGNNYYKLGRTSSRDTRISSYASEYGVKKSDIKFLYEVEFTNEVFAEKFLFYLLQEYRMYNIKEFFKANLETIKNTMNQLKLILENTPIIHNPSMILDNFDNIMNENIENIDDEDEKEQKKYLIAVLNGDYELVENIKQLDQKLKPYKCEFCKDCFSTKDNMLGHLVKSCKEKIKFEEESKLEEDRKKEEILVKFMEKQAEELRIREEKQAEEQRKVIEEQRKREERLVEEQRRRDKDQRKMFELLILSQTNKQVYKEYNEYSSETQDPKDTEIQELKKELEEIKQLVKGQKGIDNSNSSQNHHNHNSGTIFEAKHQNNLLNNLNLNYTNVISMNQFLYNMEHVNKIPRSDLEAIAFASENMKEVDLAETIHRTIEKNCMEQTKGMINPADGLELLPVMPVVCSDGNCRSHKEKVNEFWETVYGDKHFDRMLNIIDKRLYEVLKKKFYLEDYGKKQLFKKIKKKHTIHDMKDMQNKINGEILGKKFKVI